MRRGIPLKPATLALAVLTTAALYLAPTTATAATPRTSLTDVEDGVMCVSCREPLALAQSPQAIAERGYISTLIAQGETKAQIQRALVAQYGLAVLAKPPAHGFNLTVYILPPAILAAGLIVLALTLPKWRARTRGRVRSAASATPISAADARRLDEDLARFDS
jgi:cytochrome c-type biogenesis protein CcmH